MGFAPKFAFWFGWWAGIILIEIFVNSPSPWWLIYLSLPIGLFLMGYGLLLNAIAGRTLKKYGHFEITKGIKRPEKLVTVGIYSCMRHPAQFGSIFFGIGISLLTGNIYAMLFAGWYAFSAIYFILSIEEKESMKNFPEYCEFIKDRKPFSFSPRCLSEGIKALKSKK